MRPMVLVFLLSVFPHALAQGHLLRLSEEVNKSLPESYDPVTKLQRTSVENGAVIYHFQLDATQAEYNGALAKVKAQVLKSICAKRIERKIIVAHKADIVYRYENLRGQSLGEFLISSTHCR